MLYRVEVVTRSGRTESYELPFALDDEDAVLQARIVGDGHAIAVLQGERTVMIFPPASRIDLAPASVIDVTRAENVTLWSERWNVRPQDVKAAVDEVGPRVEDVARQLGRET